MRRLLTYLAPHRVSVAVAAGAIVGHSTLELAPPYLTKIVIDQYIPSGDLSGLGLIAVVFFATLVGSFTLEYSADMDAADDRAANHARPSDAGAWSPPEARSALLRPESGRAPDDSGDDRRGRPERAVHVRCGFGVRRSVHARGDHVRPPLARLASRARRLFGASSHRHRHPVVPDERPRVVSNGSHLDRAHQRFPPGAHHRDDDRALVPEGSTGLRGVRRDRPTASGRQHTVDLLLRGVLSGGRDGERPRRRVDPLGRRVVGE